MWLPRAYELKFGSNLGCRTFCKLLSRESKFISLLKVGSKELNHVATGDLKNGAAGGVKRGSWPPDTEALPVPPLQVSDPPPGETDFPTGEELFCSINAKSLSMFACLGSWHFLRKGAPNYKKSASIKLRPPILATKNYDPPPPHHRYTLTPKQAKIVLKSVFLNKIDTLTVVILWLPTFGSSKTYDPPIFFPKIYDPQYIWDPPSEENASPLRPT